MIRSLLRNIKNTHSIVATTASTNCCNAKLSSVNAVYEGDGTVTFGPGLGVNGLGPTLGVPRLGANGLGVNGLGANGLGVNGLGVNGLGATGLGAGVGAGVGATGLGATGLGATGLGATGLGATGLGAGVGAGVGATGLGAGVGAGVGATGLGATGSATELAINYNESYKSIISLNMFNVFSLNRVAIFVSKRRGLVAIGFRDWCSAKE